MVDLAAALGLVHYCQRLRLVAGELKGMETGVPQCRLTSSNAAMTSARVDDGVSGSALQTRIELWLVVLSAHRKLGVVWFKDVFETVQISTLCDY